MTRHAAGSATPILATADDLPPHTPVVVYAHLRKGSPDAQCLSELVSYAEQRGLRLVGAWCDVAGADELDLPGYDAALMCARSSRARAVMVADLTQLGVDPDIRAARIWRAHQAGARVLTIPTTKPPSAMVTVAGATIQAGRMGDINVRLEVRELPPPPAQLPPAPEDVSAIPGAKAAWRELDHLLCEHTEAGSTGPLLVAIAATDETCATQLATAWLCDHLDQVPDGQLFAHLTTQGTAGPISPSTVLGGWLRDLGVPTGQLPDTLAERAAWWRSLTTDRRIGVLVDGALSAAQIRALLPATPYGIILATSRWPLGGLALDGAYFIHLDPDPTAP